MLLTLEHLLALDDVAASQATGRDAYAIADDAKTHNIYRALELQGFVLPEGAGNYKLAYMGFEALRVLGEMQAAGLLPSHTSLQSGWRFLSSEVLAALEAATRNGGCVGPLTEDLLLTRGFAGTYEERQRKTVEVHLNAYGKAWLNFACRYRPNLEIDGDLANSIARMHPGYTDMHSFGIPPEHLVLLEAMELLAWSVPDREIGVLTALGQAVYETMHKGGYARAAIVLDDTILDMLAFFAQVGPASLAPEQLLVLQNLGYLDEESSLSEAARAALKVYRILYQDVVFPCVTFAITDDEVELLAAVRLLSEVERSDLAGASDPRGRQEITYKEPPTQANLRNVLLDRLVKSSRNREYWFKEIWHLDDLLASLESFGLIYAEDEGGVRVYQLTPYGEQVLDEQEGNLRTISAPAVKAITMANHRFNALATPWIVEAHEQGLIGTGGVTRAGRLYAHLAEHCPQRLLLTRLEAQVLVCLPGTDLAGTGNLAGEDLAGTGNLAGASPATTRRMGVARSGDPRGRQETRGLAWALDRLEAHRLIERLVDGQVVYTEVGRLLSRAVADALELAYPVTPTLMRLLAAIHQVGNMHPKERKVRILSQQWVIIERLTGLAHEEFLETLQLARLGHYIGEASLNSSGLHLLEAQAKLTAPPYKRRHSMSHEMLPEQVHTFP